MHMALTRRLPANQYITRSAAVLMIMIVTVPNPVHMVMPCPATDFGFTV
ncbi:MAG TPA: hypothetical protein VK157_12935 [Phycisphaerales bacterium]|nr:hypothetical protein [Phycisphaerales bacterium]